VASLKDVAKLAGVSPATVSRVINNTVPVDAATAARVRESIAKLKYRPNVFAQNLRRKHLNIIGLVVPQIDHDMFAGVIAYVDAYAVQYGYEMMLGNTNNSSENEERVIRKFLNMNVSGLIISRVSDQSTVLGMLDRSAVPAVIIDRTLEHENVDCVCLDNIGAGRLAATYLVGMGHRALACVTGPRHIHLSRERLEGFRARLLEHGIELDPRLVTDGDFGFDSGREAARRLLATGLPVSAIWAQNDLMAIGCMQELAARGIRVPQDISVVGMDDIRAARMVYPPLTTVRQPLDQMSDTAIQVLIHRLSNPNGTAEERVVAPDLVIRGSVREHGPRREHAERTPPPGEIQ
jgi:DNA-binding LacI/PurR family transcriptional regulator